MGTLLLLHFIGATIWVGGHLILSIAVLPNALKHKDVDAIRNFENKFEKIGIPALLLQIGTGMYMAYSYLPDFSLWFDFSNPVSKVISYKIILLAATFLLAIDARLRIIPKLSKDNLSSLALHIIPVTLISLLFVFVGLAFRTGWLY
ncbi:CopD family protein [Parashewanella tropica]|uniref:CopD family protein n=1 Tax=Parashewanella tropica TaxID=2547970 RepID=UPI0010597E36|nr:CopD family protein [Parashewanella tropica]